jgi:aconitate hydratase 2/2-methylisocitrate dehydratase
MEFIKGWFIRYCFGKSYKLCLKTLGIDIVPVFAPSKEVSVEGQGLTAEKIFNKKCSWNYPGKFYTQVQMYV